MVLELTWLKPVVCYCRYMYTPEGVVFLCVRSSAGRESQEQISSFPSIAKLCPHQTLRAYEQMTMSFQTRGDGNTLFLAVYRAVYTHPPGESGLGTRLQLKQTQTGSGSCVLVTHHHGWLQQWGLPPVQRTVRVLHLCFICPCHLGAGHIFWWFQH